jgi:hypothetical protein
MCRTITALLFGCLTFQLWAQTPPSQPPAAQPPSPTEPAPAGSPLSAPDASQSPLDQFKEFSAIMTGGPVPGTDDSIHIYRSGNLLRMESNEGVSYQITDLVKHETHGIARNGCLKLTVPYVRSYPFSLSGPDYKYQRTPVGTETVNGHSCRVEDLSIYIPKREKPAMIRLWEAEDLQGFPIKIETRGGPMHRDIFYDKVVLGPQDRTLFIYPDECQSGEEIGPPKSTKSKKARPATPKPSTPNQ